MDPDRWVARPTRSRFGACKSHRGAAARARAGTQRWVATHLSTLRQNSHIPTTRLLHTLRRLPMHTQRADTGDGGFTGHDTPQRIYSGTGRVAGAGIPLWHNPAIVNPGDGLPWTLTVSGGQRLLDLNLLRLDTTGHLILLERFLTGRPIRGMRILPKWIARPFRAPVERPGAPPITAQDLRHPDVDVMLVALIELRDSIPQVWLQATRRHMEDQACPTHPLCLANRLADAVDTLGRATVMLHAGSKPVMLSAVSVKGLTTLFSADWYTMVCTFRALEPLCLYT